MSETAAQTTEVLQVDCRTCGAELVFEEHLRSKNCPYCASPNIVERPASPDRPTPALAVGFGVDRERAGEIARRWLKSRGPFAHSGLGEGKVEEMRGIYLPAYLYSASASAAYRAEIGEEYTVTETYTDANGKTQTRIKTKTEWRTLHGTHDSWESEILVSASKGLPNSELEAVEPFDLRTLRRYAPGVIAGWLSEDPSIDPETCLVGARQETLERLEDEVYHFLPGDSQRSVDVRVSLEEEEIELALLPIWVLAVRFAEDREPLRLIINGQTGRTTGKVPLSAIKIMLAVFLVVGAITLFALWKSSGVMR